MIIEVKQKHIDNGQKFRSVRCPVALAAKETVGPEVQLIFGPDYFVVAGHPRARYDLPLEVQDFIRAFDDGLPVQPFTFELNYEAQ